MNTHTDELAFESAVESMLLDGGWRKGDPDAWDVGRALFPARTFAFIRDTQPEIWAEMVALHGANLESNLIDMLVPVRKIRVWGDRGQGRATRRIRSAGRIGNRAGAARK